MTNNINRQHEIMIFNAAVGFGKNLLLLLKPLELQGDVVAILLSKPSVNFLLVNAKV